VGRGQGILVKRLTTGGFLAMVLGSVPGCHAVLLPFAGRTTASCNRNREDQDDQGKNANHGMSKKHLEASRLPVSDLDIETSPVIGESRKRPLDSGYQGER
jgi:hypothetical protein